MTDSDPLHVAPVVADLRAQPSGAPADVARLQRLLSGEVRWATTEFLPGNVRDGALVTRDQSHALAAASCVNGIAVGLRTGALDDTVDASAARAQAVAAVGAVASGHRVHGGYWGHDWQGSLVSGVAALGAWLLWDELSDDVQQRFAAVVADEARVRYAAPIRYLRDVHGRYLTEGDTGAEEESWNARGMAAAVAMLPRHPQAQRWSRSLVLRMLAAYARPSEVDDRWLVQGTPVCSWLAGSNLEEDGDLQNHGFLPNPNYMRPPHSIGALMLLQIGRRPVPEVALHGLRELYVAHQRYYREDGSVHYPAGTDFGSRNVILYANDVQMTAYGIDRDDALRWQRLHGEIAEAAQQPDGRIDEPAGRTDLAEADVVAKLGEAYLALVLAPQWRLHSRELMGAPPQGAEPACRVGDRDFPDTAGEQAVAARWVDATGVLRGLPDGTFGASRTATHDELQAAVRRAGGAGSSGGSGPLTRGQAVLRLWRSRGEPAVPPGSFRDVSGEVAAAAAWAGAVGITAGRSPGVFDPDAPLTRGQLAQWLHRQLASG